MQGLLKEYIINHIAHTGIFDTKENRFFSSSNRSEISNEEIKKVQSSKFVSKIKIRKRQIDILFQKYGFVNDTNNIIQAKNNEFLNEVLNDTIQCVKKHIEKRKNYQNNKNNKENKEKKTMTRMKKSYWHSNCLLITSTSCMITFCLIVVILMNIR